MPRPKPRPEDRQRITRACSSCKASKIKCDGRCPCETCDKRGRASTCRIAGVDGRRRGSSRAGMSNEAGTASARSTYPRIQSVAGRHDQDSPMSIVLDPSLSTSASTPVRRGGHVTAETSSQAIAVTESTHDNVTYSETASSSFLQYLRETLRPYVGSSSFTEGQKHELLQPDEPHGACSDTSHDRIGLLSAYFQAVSSRVCPMLFEIYT
jgi:hypothetical protein